jgi:hypothetical protein
MRRAIRAFNLIPIDDMRGLDADQLRDAMWVAASSKRDRVMGRTRA